MIIVYTPEITERKKYIFKFIFRELFDVEYTLTDNKESLLKHNGPSINYSHEKTEGSFFVYEQKLLTEHIINSDENPSCGLWDQNPVLYISDKNADLPFDIFAASFFLLSRYEEYINDERDEHGRFTPIQSIAHRENFLQKPIINIWANAFATLLCRKFPGLQINKKAFQYISTFDIDSFYAYKGKNFTKTALGYLRSLSRFRFNEIAERTQVLRGKKKDPFNTFDQQAEWEERFKSKPLYFFHLGDNGKNDRNISSDQNPEMKEKIKELSVTHKSGLHPSYGSNGNHVQLEKEFLRYEMITGKSVLISRQHFLKMRLPETYRNLIQLGVQEDYTMGYAQDCGFRAGVAWPFRFYDLENEAETPLLIFPFVVMDGTLKDYLQLGSSEAEKYIIQMMDEVNKSGGMFISILHNHSINDRGEWKSWKKVFEKMHAYAFTLNREK
jgi:hypothetical protein